MWSISRNIYIITSKDSWFEKYAYILVEKLKKLNFNCHFCTSYQDIAQDSIAVYLSYQKIVPLQYIERTHQSLVVHASDLPKGKGFSPWVWQILEDKNSIPISLFQMAEGVDEGDIFKKERLHLDGTELLAEIREKLAIKIIEMVIEYLTFSNQPKGVKQTGQESFYRRRSEKDSELDIDKSISKQFNLLRVVDNDKYPAFFYYKNKKYILKIEEIDE